MAGNVSGNGGAADVGNMSGGSANAGGSSIIGPCTSSRPMSACVTKVKPLKLNQKWTVENFNTVIKLSKPGNCLRSQVFRHNTFSDACWQLCLYPGGKRDENANNVSLFLKMSATTPTKEVLLKAEYRFFFLDDDDKPKFSNINIGDFHAKPPKGGHSWGLRNIPRQKVLNALREDGSLLILCEIEMIPDINKVRCTSDRPVALSSTDLLQVPRAFVDGQRTLLRQGQLSDCTVEVRDPNNVTVKIFTVHKAILGAQSEVFRAMFGHGSLVEAVENKLVIEDFSPDAVQAFLKYLYTGCADSLDFEEWAEELMGLSEKYGLNHLKAHCQDHLVSRIDRSNVCQLLALADLYRADSLKQACVAFIRHKNADVLDSDAWRELKERHSKLVNEVLEQMLRTAEGLPATAGPPYKRQRITTSCTSLLSTASANNDLS